MLPHVIPLTAKPSSETKPLRFESEFMKNVHAKLSNEMVGTNRTLENRPSLASYI